MIPVLPTKEALARARANQIDERLTPLHAFRTMLNNPTATGAFAAMLTTLMFRNTVGARERELIILRTGWRTRSEYEFCQHVRVSRDLEMTEEEILGVRDPDSCKAYSDVDRALIRMADEMHERAEVSPATWAVLKRAYSDSDLVEFLLIAGFWRMAAGYLKSAKVPLDAGVPSWPEGKAPA